MTQETDMPERMSPEMKERWDFNVKARYEAGRSTSNSCVLAANREMSALKERLERAEKCVRILLESKDCLTNGGPEIPEAISEAFDIGLDDARFIHSFTQRE